MSIPDAEKPSSLTADQLRGWAAASIVFAVVAALFLALTVAIALSNPIEGLITLSTWVLSIFLGLIGAVTGAVLLAFAWKAPGTPRDRNAARGLTALGLALSIAVIAADITVIFL
jgi:hypothetical protein